MPANELLALFLLIVCSWLLVGSLFVAYRFRNQIRALWQEPVLRYPVMIIESDDWGAGPDSQVGALKAIMEVMSRYRDCNGQHPVMTLAMIMAEPDFRRVGSGPESHYVARLIDAHDNGELVSVIQEGADRGVFSLHLHGMEHYWPDALMTARQHQTEVADWFNSPEPCTETLPSELQSRWIDASQLPSLPLSPDAIKRAVAEEVETFADLFGFKPQVVVPPTFVWNETVEIQWAAQGLQTIVTPGKRFQSRDVNSLNPDREGILSGQRGAGGITYLVRDAYFEPSWGHQPKQALGTLIERTELGRATLFETHRFNFLEQLQPSLKRLEQLIQMSLTRYPDLRFISVVELADAIRSDDDRILNKRPLERWVYFLRRLKATPGFRRPSILSGTWILVDLLETALTWRLNARLKR